MTRVSIVVPCFNGGSMVHNAVSSAVAQTHEDLEIIVVNDGSSDPATLEALGSIRMDPRVTVIDQDNRGLPGALNRGIDAATGTYVIVLAHDDEFYPRYVELAARVLDERDEVGIVYCRAERFGASAGEWHLLDFDLGRMLVDNLIFASAMYRREDWQRVGGYSEAMSRGFEDHDFWLKILSLGRRVERLDAILFRYRDTDGSLSNTMIPRDRADAFALVFESNVQFYAAHADEFARFVMVRMELLNHFKRRYGRIENAVSRVGALKRRVSSSLAQRRL